MEQAVEKRNVGEWVIYVWDGVSHFLHNAKLIPFIIAVSAYHIMQVLRSHEITLTAIPLALFLDLLHYRTADQAAKTGKWYWYVGGLLTTVSTYLFNYIFYSQPGSNGELLPIWQVYLFAATVPIGILFMVLHHHENERRLQTTIKEEDVAELKLTIEKLLEENQALVDKSKRADEVPALEQALADVQSKYETLFKRVETEEELSLQIGRLIEQNRTEIKEEREITRRVRAELEASKARVLALLEEISGLKDVQTNLMAQLNAWNHINPRFQAVARFNVGELTIDEAAQIGQVTKATVSKDASKLNGSGN